MSFANTESKNNTQFKKVSFLRLTPGNHVIRFIENTEDASVIYSHFVLGKYSITCLGDNCPICDNNRKIIAENQENFRDVKGYYPKTKHYVINVLDRSKAKICPKCSEENKATGKVFPVNCTSCGEMLLEVTAVQVNKVKLLTLGVTLAGQLNSIEKAVLDVDGEEIGIRNFDIVLSVEGSNRQKTVTPIPAPQNRDVVSIGKEALEDKSKAMLVLGREEILSLLKGVSLKDIYSARGSSRQSHEVAVESVERTEAVAKTKEIISQLYPD
jgi:hypothetical protein